MTDQDKNQDQQPEETANQPEPTIRATDDARAPSGSAAQPVQTSMLNLDEDEAIPMFERPPTGNTAILSSGWRIVFKIGHQKKTLPLADIIVVGRAMENDLQPGEIGFDLTPFGAYHFGVSRRHALMTLKEGYLYLEDLNSTNGTKINGFHMTAHQKFRLRDDDEIEFARLRTVIQFKGPDTP